MKNILLRLVLPVAFCAVFIAAPVAAQTQTNKSNTVCSPIKFKSLNKYRDERWSKVFSDAQISPVLKTLLKSDYQKLKSSLEQVNYPDSLSFVGGDGILALEGGVQGLYTIMEAKLIVEPCGNVYSAVLDEGKRILYFTNDRKYAAKLPPAIEAWRTDLEKRRAQGESGKNAELPIVYKSK
jgi:hypothetical protein